MQLESKNISATVDVTTGTTMCEESPDDLVVFEGSGVRLVSVSDEQSTSWQHLLI